MFALGGCKSQPPRLPARATTPTTSGADGLAATVVDVIDGDTITVDVFGSIHTIRLLGIDTPEKPGGPRPGECFGVEASAATAALTPPGSSVMLHRDIETRDQYGRVLAWIHRVDDGLFVNLALIESGHATPLFFAPNNGLESEFVVAANLARRQGAGLWKTCGAPDIALSG